MENKNTNPLTIIAATAIGAVAGAVGVALANKTIREELQDKINETGEQINKNLNFAKEKVTKKYSELENKTKETLIEELKAAKQQLTETKEKIEKK